MRDEVLSSMYVLTHLSAARQSSTAVGKGCSGARLHWRFECALYVSFSLGLPIIDVHGDELEVHAQRAQEVVVEPDASYTPA